MLAWLDYIMGHLAYILGQVSPVVWWTFGIGVFAIIIGYLIMAIRFMKKIRRLRKGNLEQLLDRMEEKVQKKLTFAEKLMTPAENTIEKEK